MGTDNDAERHSGGSTIAPQYGGYLSQGGVVGVTTGKNRKWLHRCCTSFWTLPGGFRQTVGVISAQPSFRSVDAFNSNKAIVAST
jgi:hypothetical protein